MTIDDFKSFLKGAGMDRVAYLVGKYPDIVEPYLARIEARLLEKGLLKPAPAVSVPLPARGAGHKHGQGVGGEYESPRAGHDRARGGSELTDREGWTMLAGLVDQALAGEPEELREALKRAFLDEASKAA